MLHSAPGNHSIKRHFPDHPVVSARAGLEVLSLPAATVQTPPLSAGMLVVKLHRTFVAWKLVHGGERGLERLCSKLGITTPAERLVEPLAEVLSGLDLRELKPLLAQLPVEDLLTSQFKDVLRACIRQVRERDAKRGFIKSTALVGAMAWAAPSSVLVGASGGGLSAAEFFWGYMLPYLKGEILDPLEALRLPRELPPAVEYVARNVREQAEWGELEALRHRIEQDYYHAAPVMRYQRSWEAPMEGATDSLFADWESNKKSADAAKNPVCNSRNLAEVMMRRLGPEFQRSWKQLEETVASEVAAAVRQLSAVLQGYGERGESVEPNVRKVLSLLEKEIAAWRRWIEIQRRTFSDALAEVEEKLWQGEGCYDQGDALRKRLKGIREKWERLEQPYRLDLVSQVEDLLLRLKNPPPPRYSSPIELERPG